MNHKFFGRFIMSVIFASQGLVLASQDDCRKTTAGIVSPSTADEDVAAIVVGLNNLGLSLLKELRKTAEGEAILLSPASVYEALTIVLRGARGETKQEMLNALGLSSVLGEWNNQRFDQAWSRLGKIYSQDNKGEKALQLTRANSLWLKPGYPFSRAFVSSLEQLFSASSASRPLDSAETVDEVNGWVSEKTKGLIKTILPRPLSSDAVLLLINAIYFKGFWAREFNKEATRSLPFTSMKGTQSSVPMMYQSGSFSYAEDTDWQALELDYVGGDTSMVVLLPQPGAFERVVTDLNAAQWEAVVNKLTFHRDVHVTLPKFKLETSKQLKPFLQNMGLSRIFNERLADFLGMLDPAFHASEQIYVSTVIHKAVIDVNESGTEAAAVTAIGMVRSTSVRPPTYKVFNANRPFVYAVRDKTTGTILFFGTVESL